MPITRDRCPALFARARRVKTVSRLTLVPVAIATAFGACSSSGSVDARCTVSVRASPLRLPVAQVTRDNLQTLTEEFRAVVTLKGRPSAGNTVRFYLNDEKELGSEVGSRTSDAHGRASIPIAEAYPGYAPPLFEINEARSYQAMVDFTICSDVVSAPAPIRFAG